MTFQRPWWSRLKFSSSPLLSPHASPPMFPVTGILQRCWLPAVGRHPKSFSHPAPPPGITPRPTRGTPASLQPGWCKPLRGARPVSPHPDPHRPYLCDGFIDDSWTARLLSLGSAGILGQIILYCVCGWRWEGGSSWRCRTSVAAKLSPKCHVHPIIFYFLYERSIRWVQGARW